MKRIVVLSDLQIPYHHRKAVDVLTDFIADYQPDELWCVGDELDCPQVSMWDKGTWKEHDKTLQRDINSTHEVLGNFRQALGKKKKFYLQRSNHTQRLESYVRKWAPALTSINSLRIEELLRLDKINVTYLRRMTELAPNTVMAHGDEGNIGRYAGGTAMNLSKKIGKNVVCGHSHRQGLIQESWGYNGRTQKLWGLEVGHLMDMKQAAYLNKGTGSANWQLGFGMLYVDGRNVTPHAVPIHSDGTFVVDGEVWGGY